MSFNGISIGRRQSMAQSLGLLGLATSAGSAWTQFRVDVTGVGQVQLPIAVAGFRGEEQAPQKVSAIVLADLERSGLFRAKDGSPAGLDETSRPDFAALRQKATDSLVVGSATRLADGRFDVRYRLWDVVRGQDLGGQSYAVPASDLRLTAHRIADAVYEKLTGDRSVFSTRLAYVTKANQRYTLWVADADGEGAQSALAKPVIYVHDIPTGRRRVLANYRGSNSAPTWSPDGATVVATLSRDGGSQLYALDAGTAATAEPRRLTQSNSIDTEPEYAPDGKTVYFVSDRGGSPQIYRMPAAGGNAERVTFAAPYCISPSLSPDGRWLAFIGRVGGGFKLHVQDLSSGGVTALTDTVADESPSFAPNGRLIVYATQIQGREALMTTTLDGKIKARLGSQGGDIREPDWGPFQN
jgi:TolB protein